MKIIASLIALAAIAAPAAAAERNYPVSDFDRVVVEGPYIVRLSAGRPSAASAVGSQAALDRVTIDVQGQTLRIRRNRNAWGGNNGAQEGPVEIVLGTRLLRSARLIGPGRLELDRAEGLQIDFTVEGSGIMRAAAVRADTLSLGLRGSGRFEIAGIAGTLRAVFEGTGDVAASGLRVQDATVTTNTIGTVELSVARSVTVNANGLGDVRISGAPACTVRGPGGGQVSCGRLDQP